MKLAFLGDSITECEGGYVDIVAKEFGANALNYGIGGTCIAKQDIKMEIPRYNKDFLSRLNDIDVSSDILFVFGGVNDYGHGEAAFGDASDKSDYTFCGAVNKIVKVLLDKFGQDKLCFILPYKTYQCDKPNKHDKTLKDYVYLLKRVLDKNNIDYINLYEDVFNQPLSDKEEEFIMDGLHPTLRGHQVIAKKVIEYLNKKLSK